MHELNPFIPNSDAKQPAAFTGHARHRHHHHHHGHHYRNQHPRNSIDVWMTTFHIMSYIAVATNTALLGVDQDLNTPGHQGPFSYVEDKLGIDFGIELSFAALFFVEHGLVALKSWISYLLPPRRLLSQVVQDGRITSVGESSTEASSSGYETTGTAKGYHERKKRRRS